MEIRSAYLSASSDDPESVALQKRLESVAIVLQKDIRDILLSSRTVFVESHLTHACLGVVDEQTVIVICRGLYNLLHFRTALTAICSKLAQNESYSSPIANMPCADAMMLAGQVVLFDAYAELRPPATVADILSSAERRGLELGVNTSLLLLALHETGHQALGHSVPKQVANEVSAQQMASCEKPRRELELEADAYSISAIAEAWRPQILASLFSLHDVFHFLEIFGIQPSVDYPSAGERLAAMVKLMQLDGQRAQFAESWLSDYERRRHQIAAGSSELEVVAARFDKVLDVRTAYDVMRQVKAGMG